MTIDDTIMPWSSNKQYVLPGFYGNIRGSLKNSTNFTTSPPKMDIMTTLYQNVIVRYYYKVDYVIGMIGGATFLIFLALSCFVGTINLFLFEVKVVNELLIEVNVENMSIELMNLGICTHILNKINICKE